LQPQFTAVRILTDANRRVPVATIMLAERGPRLPRFVKTSSSTLA